MTAAVVGLWVLAAIPVAAIAWGAWTGSARRRVATDVRYLRILPAEVITDLDMVNPVQAELAEYPSVLYPDAYDASVAAVEYWAEVQDCCGGRDKTCGHARG